MDIIQDIATGCQLLRQGKIIAYPTEAVYGLGCDPFNKEAVERLLLLKQRAINKGFIILIAEWAQLAPLIAPIEEVFLNKVRESWPGPNTWIFPKSPLIPGWLCGDHETIAIRMSAHPVAQGLCQGGPLISTSANKSGHQPALNITELAAQIPDGIDAIIAGDLGGAQQPSAIYEIFTGKRLR